jgi:Putative Zn-dependent protease, contains TPR repeats
LIVADRARESLHFLKSAAKHDPGNTDLALLLAEVYFQAKDYSRALECLRPILDSKPDNFEAPFFPDSFSREQAISTMRNSGWNEPLV